MENDTSALGLPPSGRWSGYYAYRGNDAKHRMTLHLTFAGNGNLDGDGIDDVGLFRISGIYNADSREALWTKAYVGMHSVEYRGAYDGRNILGSWTLAGMTGPFRIWPGEEAEDLGAEEKVEIEEPEEVLV